MIIKAASRLGNVKEYYFSKKLREIAELRSSGKSILNLGIGNPDLPPHESIISALKKSAENPSWHGYQSYMGLPELREAYLNWLQNKFGLEGLDPNKNILPLIGSKEGIMHISMAFINEGDEVLVPNPGYPAYASATELAGGKLVYYDLTDEGNWLPDFEAIEQQDLSNVKIMWLNYPHMPTGTRATRSLFERSLAFAKRNNILLCHDNPYAFIRNRGQALSILDHPDAMDYALELHSLSKTHNMAGWRFGAVVGHEDLIQVILRFKSNMDSGQFKPMQMAAIEALNLGQLWYDDQNDLYEKRQTLVCQLFDLLGCEYRGDQSGLFVWGKIPVTYKDGYALSDELLYRAGVFITPGGIFGSNGNQFVRISLCLDENTLNEALKRARQFVSQSKLAHS